MTENRYCVVDKTTYEENLESFICDKEIMQTIALLNKSGYVTTACCAGHYEVGYTEQLNVDLSFLEDAKNDPKSIVREVREDGFDCWIEKAGTFIYVQFQEDYRFSNLPNGFQLEDNSNQNFGITLRHMVHYYDANKRRKKEEIEKELEYYRDELNKWAIVLSQEKERGR